MGGGPVTAVYILVRGDQSPAEAWADGEGLYTCAGHRDQWISTGEYRLVPVPDDLADDVRAFGQCGHCWEEWAEGLRRSCEADADARLDDYLHRHR